MASSTIFGKCADDLKGKAALAKWLAEKDDLLAGRKPRATNDGPNVADLCDRFLDGKRARVTSGELTETTRRGYMITCRHIVRFFGRSRLVEDLRPDDFRSYRDELAKTNGLVGIRNQVRNARSVFSFASKADMIERPVKFGPEFVAPSARAIRKQRTPRMYEAAEIRTMLEHGNEVMRAMVLLAVNGGLGNADVERLTISSIDFATGWMTYARVKTGTDRRIPLWPETITAVQAAIAARPKPTNKELGDRVFLTKHVRAVKSPGGLPTFCFGDSAGPVQKVGVFMTASPQPFRLGVHEVTQGQWKAVMGTEPWKGEERIKEGENIAATFISWEAAIDFCRRLTDRERAAGRLRADQEYWLPSEAQWEWACRAGSITLFTFGDKESQFGKYAWYRQNAMVVEGEEYAHPVGLKLPNPWGLYDIHGNVWEWCSDWHREMLQAGMDPVGPVEGSYRVYRGGSWTMDAWWCRSSFRSGGNPSSGIDRVGDRLGFRVAVVPSNSASTPTVHGQDARGQRDVTPPTQTHEAPPPAGSPFDADTAKAHQQT